MLADAPAPPPEPLPAIVRRALRRDLRAVVAAGAPGAIVRVDRGRLSWSAAAGRADLATGRPMRPVLHVRVGSLTKTFVATAGTPRELVGVVAGRPRGEPGFAYSNTDYALAGMIVERVTGRPLRRVLERRIVRPLGLRGTAFPVHAAGLPGPYARGYSLARDAHLAPVPGPLLDYTTFDPSMAWGAGNAISTAGDLARFYRALLGGRLLPPRLLAAMERTVATGHRGSRYGLGLFAFHTPCGRMWGNDGDIAGFSTRAMATRDGRRQAEVVVNADAAPDAVQAPLERLDDAAVCAAAGARVHH